MNFVVMLVSSYVDRIKRQWLQKTRAVSDAVVYTSKAFRMAQNGRCTKVLNVIGNTLQRGDQRKDEEKNK